MVVWINGPFGVGKSTAARAVTSEISGWRIFDPEEVGFMLRANLTDYEFNDFQELEPWRKLVPICIREIHRFTGSNVVAVQTVIRQDYWAEIRAGLEALGMRPRLAVLTAESDSLRERIRKDTSLPAAACAWRNAHIESFKEALSGTSGTDESGWLSHAADIVIDTSAQTPSETAAALADFIRLEGRS